MTSRTESITTISIHALLAESDSKRRVLKSRRIVFLSTLSLRRATRHKTAELIINVNFYPRSPCGERQTQKPKPTRQNQFLSTLSLRRATRQHSEPDGGRMNFYPRSPCGERRKSNKLAGQNYKFLSTLSLRRATARRESRQQPAGISIHALLAESDAGSARGISSGSAISIHALLAESDGRSNQSVIRQPNNFYPRSPCGERLRQHN